MTRRMRGAALAVAMLLLTGLGTLALTAAAAAAAALALSAQQQSGQQAFEAAEAAVAHALVLAARTRDAGAIPRTALPVDSGGAAEYAARIDALDARGALPTGFSLGEHAGAFAARHYFIVADGRAGRGARVRIEQGFYLVVPEAGP